MGGRDFGVCFKKDSWNSPSNQEGEYHHKFSNISNTLSFLNPLKYHVLENIMEDGAFAHLEQMLHFPEYFQKYSKLY